MAVEQIFNTHPSFKVRDATLNDVEALTELWYQAFNTSHPFWETMTPDDPATRRWWNEVWAMGIKAGPHTLRTFIVEDRCQGMKPVAFARWHVPQTDGNQDIPLPPYLESWDAELVRAFWGGMPTNRRAVMGEKPHWMLEFLGVSAALQKSGLGFGLVDWGCRQADAQGLDVYLDATIMGLPFYKKRFGFQDRKLLPIPPRSSFGQYWLMAVVRPARFVQSLASARPEAETKAGVVINVLEQEVEEVEEVQAEVEVPVQERKDSRVHLGVVTLLTHPSTVSGPDKPKLIQTWTEVCAIDQ